MSFGVSDTKHQVFGDSEMGLAPNIKDPFALDSKALASIIFQHVYGVRCHDLTQIRIFFQTQPMDCIALI